MGDAPRSSTGYGYRRLRAQHAGAGAIELLWSVHRLLAESEDGQLSGTVEAVFDRTLYLSLPCLDGRESLLALGTRDLRNGPLVVHLNTSPGFTFQDLNCRRGVECVVCARNAGAPPGEMTIQLAGGNTVAIGPDVLQFLPDPGSQSPTFDSHQFAPDSRLVRANRRLLRWHFETATPDGLGLLPQLRSYHQGHPQPELEAVVTALVETLTSDRDQDLQLCSTPVDGEPDRIEATGPLVDLVGRGPGGTPSGDDVLVGVLLVLLGLTDPDVATRVRALGRSLCEVARERTTAVSHALLVQACRRRGARPAVRCLQALTDPDATPSQRRNRSLDIVAAGHTSGADTLTGMLTTTTAVLPRVATAVCTS